MLQHRPDRVLRGAEAIRKFANSLLGDQSEPFSRHSVYRAIQLGRFPVTRMGAGRNAEVLSTEHKIAAALGLDAPAPDDVSDEQAQAA